MLAADRSAAMWWIALARNIKIAALAARYGAGRTWIEDEIRGAA